MRQRKPKTIKLSCADQDELERLVQDGRTEQQVARQSLVLLLHQERKTVTNELCRKVGMARTGMWYLCQRYEIIGLDAVCDAPRSGRSREISALERVAIEQLACTEPAGVGLEMTHWSTRSLAKITMQRGLMPPIKAASGH
jgi:hypothetical protein